MRVSVGKKTLRLAQFAMLLAIEAVVCFTPLGSLPAVGPLVATLGMV
ncbi:MAG TPA: ECF transporter S component, partial [Ruminococcaceae bacterium]|nr:ECF transporter S component [Oscillospiraceae bacterium]